MSTEEELKEEALRVLDSTSVYLNNQLNAHFTFICEPNTVFTLCELEVRLEDLKLLRPDYAQLCRQAIQSKLSSETVSEYQRKFNEDFYDTEQRFIEKMNVLKSCAKPDTQWELLDNRLLACEDLIKKKDEEPITQVMCDDQISELRRLQVDFNAHAKYDLLHARNKNERTAITGKHERVSKRLTSAIASFDKIRDGVISSRPTPRNNPKIKSVDLPMFDGDRSKWRHFHDLFMALVHKVDYTDCVKLNFLQTHITDPSCPISGYSPDDANYANAWTAVCNHYGDDRVALACHFDNLTKMKYATDGTYEKIMHVTNEARRNLLQIKRIAAEQKVDFADAMVAHIVMSRLDEKSKEMWRQEHKSEIPLWQHLEPFLADRTKYLYTNPPAQPKKPTTFSKPNSFGESKFKPSSTTKCFAANPKAPGEQKFPCAFECSESHAFHQCPKFNDMTPTVRKTEIEKLSRCVNCLSKHSLAQCRKPAKCRVDGCGEKHHTLLHAQPAITVPCKSAETGSDRAIFSTMIIWVKGRGTEWHKARAVSDTAAGACFMRKCFADALRLKTSPCHIEVIGINNKSEPMIIRRQLETAISNADGNPQHRLTFLLVPKVMENTPERKVSLEDFGIPSGTKLADPHFNVPAPVDILLGNNVARLLETGKIVHLENGIQLFATIFGDAVAGQATFSTKNPIPIKLTQCKLSVLKDLNENIKRFWQIEDYRNEKKAYTAEEIYCEEHFQRTFKRLPNGKCQVDIAFKPSLKFLGENRKSAHAQFISNEKRMQKCQHWQLYVDFMREYRDSNDMSLDLSDPLVQSGFLAFHCVLNLSSTTTKLRVVFNASAQTSSSYSLNDVQCVGPVIQSDSAQLLMKFRLHNIVEKADISKFYRTIEVNPDQRKYQRILWRESPNDPVQIYKLNTLVYGQAYSSFGATRALQEIANQNRAKYPDAAKVIEKDFYVDDMLTGAPTVEQAIKLKDEVSKILDSAHMKLRKFVSNSSEFMASVPESERETCTNTDKNYKVLGCIWNPGSDYITFDIDYQEPKKLTKRSTLSAIAKPMALDPLGLIAPVVLRLKLFMKKVHQLKTAWDIELPAILADDWKLTTRSITDVNKIKIPRRVIIEDHIKLQLLCCSDASEVAYGASVFVRSINNDGVINCQLLKAKSHVAQDGVEIPKLELCGLDVAAALLLSTSRDFIYPIDNMFVLSDSIIALNWIKSGAKGQQTFVFNRAQRIRQLSNNVTFMHVRTGLNPADWVSRGLSAPEILQDLHADQFWWRGPDFFRKPVEEWPETLMQFKVNDDDFDSYFCENDTIHCMHATVAKEDNEIFKIVENANSFLEAKQTIAAKKHDPVELKHLEEAEFEIAREYQRVYMPCEFKLLSTGKSILSSSKYFDAHPKWDTENRLIRGQGRNIHANLPRETTEPIILPKCPLTRVLAIDAHRTNMHVGKATINSEICKRYEPYSLMPIARNVVKTCNECFRARPRLASQLMAPLPADRVNPAPAFYTTGVDFAGPFTIKTSKIRNAPTDVAYIALFICFATKAVHIEVVSSLTTEDFYLSLTRFFNRRYQVKRMWSDNGTNFVGCNNRLKQAYDFLKANENAIRAHLLQYEVEWRFIPPRSPQHGGLWESNIKVAKHHLYATYADAKFTFEELTTIASRIEAIMNSRPIISVTDDPNDFRIITPAHLITGKEITGMPEPDFSNCKFNALKRFDRVLKAQQELWAIIMREHIATHRRRAKDRAVQDNLRPGMKVMIHVDKQPSLVWPIGKIIAVYPGKDNLIRVVDVETPDGIYQRSVNKIAVLPTQEELDAEAQDDDAQ